MVVNGAVQSGEFLQTSHLLKPEHSPLPSPEWLVRILGAVIQPAAAFTLIDRAENLHGGTIRWKPICRNDFCHTMSLQLFPVEFQRCRLVSSFRDEAFEHFAFVIDGPPETVLFAFDHLEDLVELPTSVAEGTHGMNAASEDLGG